MNQTTKTIAKKHTSCKFCVFAQYKDITQYGCTAKELDYHKKSSCDILECYDSDKEFYVINDIKCAYYRNHQWAYNKSPPYLDEVYEETKFKYQAIIVADQNFNDVKTTVNSLVGQSLKPSHISIIRPIGSKIIPRILAEYLIGLSIPWRSENAVDQQLTINNHIDIILDFTHFDNYVVFQAGFVVPQDTFSYIDRHIRDRTFPYLVLLPNSSNNGLLMPCSLHIALHGNQSTSIIDKIQKKESLSKRTVPINIAIPNFPS